MFKNRQKRLCILSLSLILIISLELNILSSQGSSSLTPEDYESVIKCNDEVSAIYDNQTHLFFGNDHGLEIYQKINNVPTKIGAIVLPGIVNQIISFNSTVLLLYLHMWINSSQGSSTKNKAFAFLDIKDGTNMQILALFDPGFNLFNIVLWRNYIYGANSKNGIAIFKIDPDLSISSITNYSYFAEFKVTNSKTNAYRSVMRVSLWKSNLVVFDGCGIALLNLNNSESPQLVNAFSSNALFNSGYDIWFDGDIAYLWFFNYLIKADFSRFGTKDFFICTSLLDVSSVKITGTTGLLFISTFWDLRIYNRSAGNFATFDLFGYWIDCSYIYQNQVILTSSEYVYFIDLDSYGSGSLNPTTDEKKQRCTIAPELQSISYYISPPFDDTILLIVLWVGIGIGATILFLGSIRIRANRRISNIPTQYLAYLKEKNIKHTEPNLQNYLKSHSIELKKGQRKYFRDEIKKRLKEGKI